MTSRVFPRFSSKDARVFDEEGRCLHEECPCLHEEHRCLHRECPCLHEEHRCLDEECPCLHEEHPCPHQERRLLSPVIGAERASVVASGASARSDVVEATLPGWPSGLGRSLALRDAEKVGEWHA